MGQRGLKLCGSNRIISKKYIAFFQMKIKVKVCIKKFVNEKCPYSGLLVCPQLVDLGKSECTELLEGGRSEGRQPLKLSILVRLELGIFQGVQNLPHANVGCLLLLATPQHTPPGHSLLLVKPSQALWRALNKLDLIEKHQFLN